MPLDEHERKVVAPELEVPELDREPANHPFLINPNVLADVLAHLVAVYAGKSVLLKADAAGALMVNSGAGGGGGASWPFYGDSAPDHRALINEAAQGYFDFGSAANRRVAYQYEPMTAEYVRAAAFDSDTIGGANRQLWSPTAGLIAVAYTTGRYFEVMSDLTTSAVILMAWDL